MVPEGDVPAKAEDGGNGAINGLAPSEAPTTVLPAEAWEVDLPPTPRSLTPEHADGRQSADEEADFARPTVALFTAVGPEPAVASPPRRRYLGPVLFSVALALALTVAGVLAYLWVTSASDLDTTRGELRSSRAAEARLESETARLERELADAQALASRRAAVLAQTQRVLKAVEPLLSSVDELQSITSDIQEGRANYTSASESLKLDLIALANYLLDVEPYYADWGWVNSLIGEINGEIDTVNYYGSTLDDYDGRYSTASQRFDTRATGLNQSIRALQKQLKQATE